MRNSHGRNMYIKLEKLEEEIHTLYDLKYGETNEKVGK
jgi:hypothetical protein